MALTPYYRLAVPLAVATVVVAAVAITACGWILSGGSVLHTLRYPSPERPCDHLLVLLPGRGSKAADFAKEGLVQAVRDAGVAVDMVAADARLPLYFGGRVVTMLERDVMQPAREQGYRDIWLAGISLGGLGALLYTENHPHEVSGVILLAPFLGDPPLIEEIQRAGGVRGWEPGAVEAAEYQRHLWAWLKEVSMTPDAFPPIYLGFGREDRFAAGHELLATILPRDRVFTGDGGHEWSTWRPLWGTILAHADLPRWEHGRRVGRP